MSSFCCSALAFQGNGKLAEEFMLFVLDNKMAFSESVQRDVFTALAKDGNFQSSLALLDRLRLVQWISQ